ncbi:MAG: SagB/ThcOx family dehydrogenase [Candidatus Cloacimonadota bacterium]|nr:SagB/ThcOx family dehydrogenase [Candidatus Cloacimonadota bacterium]
MKYSREYLKDTVRNETDFTKTDQALGKKMPPIQKEYDKNDIIIKLPKISEISHINEVDVFTAIKNRKSHRSFVNDYLTLEELSFLLYSTQGIRDINNNRTFRTVPSAGNRHPFETYILACNVDGLDKAVFRYLPIEHELLFIREYNDLKDRLVKACRGQKFAGDSAVTFVWTTIPYRTEWRYSQASYKVIALDAGHICQNLYLACEAISSGTCAIAAYDQQKIDKLIGVDGEEEFTIYLSPVGRV